MPKILEPILPILSILGYWAVILGTFEGPGSKLEPGGSPTWAEIWELPNILGSTLDAKIVGLKL